MGGTGTYGHSKAHLGSGTSASGIVGVTATLTETTKITLTATHKGLAGNDISVANVVGNAATDGTLSGGSIQALRDREGLRTRLTRRCGQFGFDSQWGGTSWREDSTDEVASFHKVNRNPIKRIKEG